MSTESDDRRFGERRFHDRRPDDGQVDNRQSYGRPSDNGQSDHGPSDDGQSDHGPSDNDGPSDHGQSDDGRPDDRPFGDRRPEDRRSCGRQPDDRPSGDGQPDGRQSGDRPPEDGQSGDRGFWDAAADRFDDEPDHGLRDPRVREAWAVRLRSWLPEEPSDVLDLGCGTGSLALLAAGDGHRVTGVDRSPRMVELAREKLAGTDARVLVGDAARPPAAAGGFDVVLVRHVLWTLPDPGAVLRRWAELLRPGGRLVLIEGRWGTVSPVGITARTLAGLAAPLGGAVHIEQLGHDPALWGRQVEDERYVAVVRPTASLPRRHAEIVDVHLILLRGDEVLLARRAGTGYADGLLHAPSGHLEDGEDVRSGMIREAGEEIGVELAPDELEAAVVMQHRAPDGRARIGWFFAARHDSAREPVNREPDKCSELGWYPLDALPDDMVAYCRAGLEAYRAGLPFLLHLHEKGDSIAYDPAGPHRAVPLSPSAVPGSRI